MKRTRIITAAVTLALVLPALSSLAQGFPGNPPGGGPGAGAPIDGGSILLVLGAAAYGYKKLKENKPEISE